MSRAAGKGLTGRDLKLTALAFMVIDHLGAGLLEPWILEGHGSPAVITLDFFVRALGRLAFPLYIFCLLEGFFHTRSRARYLRRLALAALVIEPFFDIGFCLSWEEIRAGKLLDFSYQNVFVTMTLGFAAITAMDFIRTAWPSRRGSGRWDAGRILALVLSAAVLAGAAALNKWVLADYGWTGVAAIGAGYLARVYGRGSVPAAGRNRRVYCAILLVLVLGSSLEAAALFAIPLVMAYNGERGGGSRWFFYIAYPLHIFLIGLVRMGLGFASPF